MVQSGGPIQKHHLGPWSARHHPRRPTVVRAAPGVRLQADGDGGGDPQAGGAERVPVRQRVRGPDVHDLRLQQEGMLVVAVVVEMIGYQYWFINEKLSYCRNEQRHRAHSFASMGSTIQQRVASCNVVVDYDWIGMDWFYFTEEMCVVGLSIA